MAVTVTLDHEVIGISEHTARFLVARQPLVRSVDKYVVIGQRFDLTNRRFVYICEQVVFTPLILAGLIWDERWEASVSEPGLLIIDERWDLLLPENPIFVIDERWDVVLQEPGQPDPVTGAIPYVIDERWEA